MTRGIRQRAAGSWEIVVYTGRSDASGRYQRVTRTIRGTKREAERVRAEMLTDAASGALVRPTRETVRAFLARWLDSERELGARSRSRYRWVIEQHVIPHIGDVPLQMVDASHILLCDRRWRAHGLAASTIHDHYRVLARAFRQATRWRLVQRNPFDDVDVPGKPLRAIDVLDERDLLRLLDLADRHRFRVAYRLLVFTGMRVGEVLGLRWRDVDLAGGVVRVAQQHTVDKTFEPVKTHRSARPIDLDAGTIAFLREHRVAQNERRLGLGPAWADHDLVACDDLGHPFTHSQIDGRFKGLLRQLGLPATLRPHDLRHAHASHLLAQGVDLKVIQERLGHASPAFTLTRYGHALPGRQRSAAEGFADRLSRKDTSDEATS